MESRLLLPLLCCSSYEGEPVGWFGEKCKEMVSPLQRRRRLSFFLPPVILATYHYWRCLAPLLMALTSLRPANVDRRGSARSDPAPFLIWSRVWVHLCSSKIALRKIFSPPEDKFVRALHAPCVRR